MIRIPSATTLMRITNDDRALALRIRRLLDGRADAFKESASAARHWSQVGHFPSFRKGSHEMILYACDDLLGGSGVESLNPECEPQNWDEGIAMCPAFSYINFGDTYIDTLIRDHKARCWRVMSWGDALGKHERECKVCRKLAEEEHQNWKRGMCR